MHDMIEMAIRSVLAIASLFASTKVMGRRELAEMCMFDYILGISIGAVGAELALNLEDPWYDYLIVMAIFVAIHELITWSTLKSLWARKFFDGVPIIIMEDGKILEKNLKRIKYDINTFLKECRVEGYFDLSNINTAIMETNGKISFIQKTKEDAKQQYIVANIIIDGKIMENNLKAVEKNEQWLLNELKRKDKKLEQILLGTYSAENEFKIYLKDEKVHMRYVLE